MVAWIKRNGYSPEKFGRDTPYQFDKAIQTWLKSSTVSPEWVQAKKAFARKFFIPFFKKTDIRKIQTPHVQEFYATLLDKHYSPKYCKILMDDLKAFLNFYRENLPTFPHFPKIEIQESVIRWLTSEDQDKVFQYIPQPDLPIFEFMRRYGCRTNEASGLLKANVFLDHIPPYLVLATVLSDNGIKLTTKTKRIKILPIIPELRWLFEGGNGSEFVFVKKWRGRWIPYSNQMLNLIWNRANQASGVQKINLYNGTRHSFGCQRLNEGYSLDEIKQVMGHSSTKMTERYAAYTLTTLQGIIKGKIYTPFIHSPDVKLLEDKRNKSIDTGAFSLPFRKGDLK